MSATPVYVIAVVAALLKGDWVLAAWSAKQAFIARAAELWDLPDPVRPRRDPFLASFDDKPYELPGSWYPSPAHSDLAQRFDLDLEGEVGEFRAWCARNRRVCGNWEADFELWLRRSKKYARAWERRTSTLRRSQYMTPAEQRTNDQLQRIEMLRARERGDP